MGRKGRVEAGCGGSAGGKGNGRANLDHVRHSGKGTMTGAECSRISKSRWLRLWFAAAVDCVVFACFCSESAAAAAAAAEDRFEVGAG